MGGGRPDGEAWSDAMDGLSILTTENTEDTEGGSNGPLQTYFFSLHFSVSSVLSVVNACGFPIQGSVAAREMLPWLCFGRRGWLISAC